MNYKQFVIVPKYPKMSTGKIASQVAHATFIALEYENQSEKLITAWKKSGMCVIILECKDTLQLMSIDKYLEQWKIPHHLYIDEGFTEVDMGTPTALATGILTEDKFWIFEKLKVFK
jgi:peptidyl-tRNA hydrolase